MAPTGTNTHTLADKARTKVGKANAAAKPTIHVAKSKRQTKSGSTNKKLTSSNNRPKATKSDTVQELLRSGKGATIESMMQATGWQSHSVRGFLSGTVKKKLGLKLESERDKDGTRRYRIVEQAKAS
ncbi:MAG: DUF3489 domain-containing protein [Rhizobiaceae bacterium]|nr:DUF3489 domain-containing protein [Rhizobiaceae bacterium]